MGKKTPPIYPIVPVMNEDVNDLFGDVPFVKEQTVS